MFVLVLLAIISILDRLVATFTTFAIYTMLDKDTILQELQNINTLDDLTDRRQTYLGKKGQLNILFKEMKDLSPAEKKQRGQELSDLKNTLTAEYTYKEQELTTKKINEELANDIVDVSVIPPKSDIGHYSLLAKTRREIEEICHSMGFAIEYGHDVVTKYENFESVNIPLTHPATEMHDTFYLNEKDKTGEPFVLRTHTSAMQNYYMKKYGTPCRIVIPSKVYRYENVDATHDTMFYQLEGIFVNKNVSIAHFKDMMQKLLKAILKTDVETRMRPGFFPFTEPSFEIEARYDIVHPDGSKEKSKWTEILGAGMIHPNVLTEAGIDPDTYSGFAFGLGINRIVAVRHRIKDIRLFTNGDLRFARSFK